MAMKLSKQVREAAAERKARQRERDAAAGIVERRFRIHESWVEELKEFAAMCREPKPTKCKRRKAG